MKRIRLANADRRDTTVAMLSVAPPRPPRPGLADGGTVTFRRYLAAVEEGCDPALTERFGEDYGERLIEGDPEIDPEKVGRFIERTDTVWLSSSGEVLYASPQVVEILLGPDGQERERRAPEDVPPNIADELPVRWTGRKLPKADAVRRFAFRRTLQLRHVDGLTYDFLHKMARELHDDGALVLLGAGPKGRDPLVLQTNGQPCRGLLEGRVDGPRYALLLHLSNMEIKRPQAEGGAS